jgi:hypothetical protein
MIKPTVHTNGDRAETLLEQYRTALNSVSDAMVALRECTPNGRNYYPISNEAIHVAIAEHSKRVEALQKVYDELLDLAQHVSQFLKV